MNLDCNCDPNGSEALTCDAETGQCHCKCNVIGDKCDTCASGFHNFPATADENCHGMISQDFFSIYIGCILFRKYFWPMRKKCSSDWETLCKF